MSAMTRRKYFHWQIWEIQIWCRSTLTTPKISIHPISFLTKEDWGATYSPKQTLATTHSIYTQVCASCSTFYQFFFYIYGHYINTLIKILFLNNKTIYIYIYISKSRSVVFIIAILQFSHINVHITIQFFYKFFNIYSFFLYLHFLQSFSLPYFFISPLL